MNGNNSNTFLAIGLSVLVLVLWQVFYIGPIVEEERKQAEIVSQREAIKSGEVKPEDNAAIPQSDTTTSTAPEANATAAPAEEEKRLTIDTDLLIGSLNLRGARIDDLRLKKYKVENEENSPLVTLLSPRNSDSPYFAEFGYLKSEAAGEVPSADTLWNTNASSLGKDGTVTLNWTNDKGIRFERDIALSKALDGWVW